MQLEILQTYLFAESLDAMDALYQYIVYAETGLRTNCCGG
jgi:hypothetical protein